MRRCRRVSIDYALAGTVLMDLAFAHRVDTDLETLFVIDRTPTGNPLLDPVFAKIAAREEASDTVAWLRTLAAEDAARVRDQALLLLVRRGLLERRERSFNWAFARPPGALADARHRDSRRRTGHRIDQRVRHALLSDPVPDPRDMALIGLLDTCGLLGKVVPNGDAGRLGPRVGQLRRLDLTGRELGRATSDIERGVAADLCGGRACPRTAVQVKGCGAGVTVRRRGTNRQRGRGYGTYRRPAPRVREAGARVPLRSVPKLRPDAASEAGPGVLAYAHRGGPQSR